MTHFAIGIPLLGCIMFNLVFEISQSYFVEDFFFVNLYILEITYANLVI